MHAFLMSTLDWRKKYRAMSQKARDQHRGECDQIINALNHVYDSPVIAQRLDALSNLLFLIVEQLQEQTTHPALKKELVDLYHQALKVTGCILNETNHRQILKRLAERERYNDIDPDFMPWEQPTTSVDPRTCPGIENEKQFKLRKILKKSKNRREDRALTLTAHGKAKDAKYALKYLTPEEREAYRLIPYQGHLVKLQQQGENEKRQLRVNDFTTDRKKKPGVKRIGIFVVSLQGDIFVGDKENGHFHHSSFLPDQPVMFAGTLLCNKGKIEYMDNLSGHFQPKMPQVIQARTYLRAAGVLNKEMTFKIGAKHPHQLRRWNICSFNELRYQYLMTTVKSEQKRLNRWSLFSTGGEHKARVWHDLEERIEAAAQSDAPIPISQILDDWKKGSLLKTKSGQKVKNETVLKMQRCRFDFFKKTHASTMKKLEAIEKRCTQPKENPTGHHYPPLELRLGRQL